VALDDRPLVIDILWSHPAVVVVWRGALGGVTYTHLQQEDYVTSVICCTWSLLMSCKKGTESLLS
jgi:steroid 5-alpha reductase family enzyme